MTAADVPSVWAPATVDDVRTRLALITETEPDCRCGDSLHENTIHDLATDDVPWLIARCDAVEALHQPVRVATVGGIATMCRECRNEPRRSTDRGWPCPTIVALRGDES